MSEVKISVFNQILAHVDINIFMCVVKKYQGINHGKHITTWLQMVSLIFI